MLGEGPEAGRSEAPRQKALGVVVAGRRKGAEPRLQDPQELGVDIGDVAGWVDSAAGFSPGRGLAGEGRTLPGSHAGLRGRGPGHV